MINLIFIEGISGVGKSTATPILCEKLRDNGYRANYYLEGDINSPADSFWNAYLTKFEYEKIQFEYPDFIDGLLKNCIDDDDYVLVRYQDKERQYYSPELYEYLKEREFCYNPVNPLPNIQKCLRICGDGSQKANKQNAILLFWTVHSCIIK